MYTAITTVHDALPNTDLWCSVGFADTVGMVPCHGSVGENCTHVSQGETAIMGAPAPHNGFIPEGSNVVSVWWDWEDSSLSIFIVGSGTILGGSISGCNMSPTNTRICFISVCHTEPVKIPWATFSPINRSFSRNPANFLHISNGFLKTW